MRPEVQYKKKKKKGRGEHVSGHGEPHSVHICSLGMQNAVQSLLLYVVLDAKEVSRRNKDEWICLPSFYYTKDKISR